MGLIDWPDQDRHTKRLEFSLLKTNRRVAVVGAGVSGLIAARMLQDHDCEVTVFDKGCGPGGRAATRRSDSGLSFDHGAQYFTARNSQFSRSVEAWSERGVVAEWCGRIVEIEGSQVWPKTDQPRRYVGVPGMKAIARHLAVDLSLIQDTRIIEMSRVSDLWALKDAAGRTHEPFDQAIIALPAPQAAELLGTHPFAAEVRSVPMTPCWAVMAAFEQRIDVEWDGAFVRDSSLAWVARDSSKPGRAGSADCWVLHASPAWSAAHLDHSREDVASALLAEFIRMTHDSSPPIHLDAHRWLFSATPLSLDRLTLSDKDSRLAVCGDWLAGGRIEGAFQSGLATAQSVLEQIGSGLKRQAPQF